MVRKLIVLGIDGMDRDVIIRYKDCLPNLWHLADQTGFPKLRSVFPADTTPAWSTIYAGVDPSVHGIINFINVGVKDNTYKPLVFDDSSFKGVAFWDKLNEQGYTCAVLLPMNIKEGWKIDGMMLTRPYNGKMRVYPQSKYALYSPKVGILGTEGKFTSEKDLGKLKKDFFAKADEEIRLTRLALEHEEVDLLFSYFSTTDGIQHDFWRHCDPTHPKYPGDNAYKDTIKEMYMKMDDFVGEIREHHPETSLLIVSDHGHGARPVRTVRINELLRRGGYLVPKEGAGAPNVIVKMDIKKQVKKLVLTTVKKVGVPKWAMRIAKRFPLWKNLFASSADFNWKETKAYLSDLSALKNYSYGGIRLNENVEDKDHLADEIINYLKSVKIEGENKYLFEWIVRTNTFYHGENLNKYPEIIYQMDELYGGEWELGKDIFSESGMMYMMSPGGHRWRTAVLLGSNVNFNKTSYEMTDICPLIIDIINGR